MTRSGRRTLSLVLAGAVIVSACGDDTADDTTATRPSDQSDPSPSTTVETTPSTDVATSVIESTSTSTSTSTAATVPASDDPPLVAITAEGDAVFFAVGSTAPTMLFDGPDPDAPPPEEGPGPNVVDSVAITPDGSKAFVGLCCEPIAGAILTAEPPDLASYETTTPPVFGYGPAVSPDGRYVAVGEINGPVVSITEIATGTRLDVPTLEVPLDVYFPYDTMWMDDDRLVALGTITGGSPSGGWFAYAITISDGAVSVGDAIDLSALAEVGPGTLLRLAGVLDGDRFAVQREGESSAAAVEFSSGSIEPGGAIDVGEPARSIWLQPGRETIHVGLDERLHVGDEIIPGAYRWARR